jgi:hypothetical protein
MFVVKETFFFSLFANNTYQYTFIEDAGNQNLLTEENQLQWFDHVKKMDRTWI